MATDRQFADIKEEITANYGGTQYINADYPPELKTLLRELYGSCVTADDFEGLHDVARNIDDINRKNRSLIIIPTLEPIRKDLKTRRLSAFYKYVIIWNNNNIDAVTADDWETLSGLCRDSFRFAMAQRGSRTAARRKANVVSKFYNICRLFALKLGENENVIWNRLNIDRAADSYHAILTSEPLIYMAPFSLEQLKEGITLPEIEARNGWWNIAKRARCRDLEIFFNQTNDPVGISNELAQVAEDYLRHKYLNGQGNNLAQALQALNVVDDEEEADDDEEEENEEVEEEKPGTSAGTSGQINASLKLEAQTAPKEEKPDI